MRSKYEKKKKSVEKINRRGSDWAAGKNLPPVTKITKNWDSLHKEAVGSLLPGIQRGGQKSTSQDTV